MYTYAFTIINFNLFKFTQFFILKFNCSILIICTVTSIYMHFIDKSHFDFFSIFSQRFLNSNEDYCTAPYNLRTLILKYDMKWKGGARGVMFIGDTSSSPGQDWLHFT